MNLPGRAPASEWAPGFFNFWKGGKMKMLNVEPAYGRDYKSAKVAKADWDANKDFRINDMSSPHDGRYINKADAKDLSILCRYEAQRKVTWLQNEPKARKAGAHD